MSAVEEHKPVEKRRALGRGLDSLLPSGPRIVPPVNSARAESVMVPPAALDAARVDTAAEAGPPLSAPARGLEIQGPLSELPLREIPLDSIDENPYQTRQQFDQAALSELAESIRENGIAQPVMVRPGENGRYVLVLGDRRCRAARLAGKATVPAIVRHLGNEQAAELTIVENLQRQDLNCVEQAQAFARLSREFNLTQEQIGKRVGASREQVANYMRLLKLPVGVIELLNQGKIGFSEAKVLLEALPHLGPEEVERLARVAIDRDLTVRDLKNRVEALINPELSKAPPRAEKPVDPNVKDAERRIREALGMRVNVVSHQGNKGKVVIRYESLADFDEILARLEAR